MGQLSKEVDQFIKAMVHPKEKEINELRKILVKSSDMLSENIKWNAPNYSVDGEDRITLKINPPGKITVVFHCGASKGKTVDKNKLGELSHLLDWRGNDRALLHFQNSAEIKGQSNLTSIIKAWILATSTK